MQIGIITCDEWLRKSSNYGTLLQMYALQMHLRHAGHAPFLIQTDSSPRNALERLARACAFTLLHPWKMVLARTVVRAELSRLAKFNAAHPRNFSSFFEKYICKTRERFSDERLMASPPEADAYIVGSDQIWHSATRRTFLAFGAENALRIAYAVSTEWPCREAKWFAGAARLFPRMDAVSVREPEGVEVCARAGRADARHVCDPTLLLKKEDYLKVVRAENADEPFPRPTVLAYFLNVKNIKALPWREVVALSREREADLKVVPLQGAELAVPAEFVFTPSPAQWLNAYDKAECILTNSFHGTAFAIIMRKPFLVVLQRGRTEAQNCRFFSILEKLGLTARIWNEMGGGHGRANGGADRLAQGREKTRRVPRGVGAISRRGVVVPAPRREKSVAARKGSIPSRERARSFSGSALFFPINPVRSALTRDAWRDFCVRKTAHSRGCAEASSSSRALVFRGNAPATEFCIRRNFLRKIA